VHPSGKTFTIESCDVGLCPNGDVRLVRKRPDEENREKVGSCSLALGNHPCVEPGNEDIMKLFGKGGFPASRTTSWALFFAGVGGSYHCV
jgi:hypothetical protein